MTEMEQCEPIKFCVISLGCSKNLVDTEVMCGGLASAGFAITNVAELADVMIVNTCCFIEDARQESGEVIEEGLGWKREGGRDRVLVIAGCWPQRDADYLRREYPGVDLFCGFDALERLPELLRPMFAGGGLSLSGRVEVTEGSGYLYGHMMPRLLLTPSAFAYVKIADGCDNRCSYCAIPLIRGRFRSRPPDSIVSEVENLVAGGVGEVNLVAQDTTNYGHDLGDVGGLPELLDRLDRIGGSHWLRVLYSHPRHLTDAVLSRLVGGGHVLPYLDLPLQHISDPVLGRMGRGLGEVETRRLLDRIRSEYPSVSVRTTFLVGFPGESDEDFFKLERLVSDYRFEHVGVFTYSREPGTAAVESVEPMVPADVMELRRDRLMTLQAGIVEARNRARIGRVVRVLVEGPEPGVSLESGDEVWRGRTVSQAPDVDDCVYFVRSDAEGGGDVFTDVVIDDVGDYELWGHELENLGGTE